MGMDKKMYCRPLNAGLASETPAVARRIGRLLAALDNELNAHICEGGILEEIREFRYLMRVKLENEGWTFSYDGGDRLKVRAPGHTRPFKKNYVKEG
jgi:hypothetical protein